MLREIRPKTGYSNCTTEKFGKSSNRLMFQRQLKYFLFCFLLNAITLAKVYAGFNTEVFTYSPWLEPHTLKNMQMQGGQNGNVDVSVHLSKEYSGIIAGLKLNGINVIESRSIGGAAWQTSYIISSPGDSQVNVLNQAAGNAYYRHQWGFDNFSPSLIWNRMYSDHHHPDGNFGITVQHCPCDGQPVIAVDDGRPQVSMSTVKVSVPNDANSQVIKVRNTYQMKSVAGNQLWDKFALEQAFYLRRSVARDNRLRAYYQFRGDNNVRVANLNTLDFGVAHSLFALKSAENLPVNEDLNTNIVLAENSSFTASDKTIQQYAGYFNHRFNQADNNASNANSYFQQKNSSLQNRNYFFSPDLQYVVFVWQINGEDIGVAMRMPGINGFGGAHLLLEHTAYCLDVTKIECGNISWHSWLYNVEFDTSRSTISYGANQVRNYTLDYYIGTPEQLEKLGFKTYKITPAPKPVTSKGSITPILQLLLLD